MTIDEALKLPYKRMMRVLALLCFSSAKEARAALAKSWCISCFDLYFAGVSDGLFPDTATFACSCAFLVLVWPCMSLAFLHLRHLHCLTFDTCQVPTEALDFVSALTRHCLSGLDFVFLTWLSGLFCLALTCLSGILMPGKRCSRFASLLLCLAVALRRYQTYTATTINFQ